MMEKKLSLTKDEGRHLVYGDKTITTEVELVHFGLFIALIRELDENTAEKLKAFAEEHKSEIRLGENFVCIDELELGDNDDDDDDDGKGKTVAAETLIRALKDFHFGDSGVKAQGKMVIYICIYTETNFGRFSYLL